MNYLAQLEPLDEYNRQLQANVRPPQWRNPTAQGRYNLVVIGAGTAGLVAAAGAAGLGAKVALIERGLMGGDCLNIGCVPSKALLSAARQAVAKRAAHQFGAHQFGVDEPAATVDLAASVDFAAVMQRMRRLRAAISPHDSAHRFSQLGIDVFFGQGTFVGRDTVEVAGQKLRFKKAVIATGTRAAELPAELQGQGIKQDDCLTNATIFSLTTLPRRLIVIGGGPIGCELAQCFARFGSQVTLIEKSAHVLAREDREASMIVQQALHNAGVKLLLNARVTKLEAKPKGQTTAAEKTVWLEVNGQSQQIAGDEILLAIGRTPNLAGLGLELAGVAAHPQRGIEVDDRLRTANRNIFAAGDICSQFKFTHAADAMARIVIKNALFMGRSKVGSLVIPWCTYTSPELAHVGLNPDQAQQQGIELDTYTKHFSSVDRAVLDGQELGFVRIHCASGSDRILGATIVANQAGEMISHIVMAMQTKLGLGKISSVIHPYPTQTDAIRQLGDQYNRTRLTPLVKTLLSKWSSWTR